MGTDEALREEIEEIRPETVTAINEAMNDRLDDPSVVREDPDSGTFVLDDADKDGHDQRTRIDLERGLEIGFTESFADGTPDLKYVYQMGGGKLRLEVREASLDYIGQSARTKLAKLKADSIPLGSEDGYLIFTPSESHAQRVLTAVKQMKHYIR